jgi:hypothetical protein
MSDQGVPIETIADLVGHAGTSVTEADVAPQAQEAFFGRRRRAIPHLTQSVPTG